MDQHDFDPAEDPRRKGGVIHVPAGEGPTVWVDGDTYTVKASHESTNGALAFLEASVPPGCGPAPHVHNREDEAYYLLSGELEILDGDRPFLAHPGDFVFIPRGVPHRFRNVGLHVARMVFLFTPAGFDKFFLAAGDPAIPGQQATPWGPEKFGPVLDIAGRYGWEPGPDPSA